MGVEVAVVSLHLAKVWSSMRPLNLCWCFINITRINFRWPIVWINLMCLSDASIFIHWLLSTVQYTLVWLVLQLNFTINICTYFDWAMFCTVVFDLFRIKRNCFLLKSNPRRWITKHSILNLSVFRIRKDIGKVDLFNRRFPIILRNKLHIRNLSQLFMSLLQAQLGKSFLFHCFWGWWLLKDRFFIYQLANLVAELFTLQVMFNFHLFVCYIFF